MIGQQRDRPRAEISAARLLWRVSLARGRRSARSRRQAAMRLPGRSRAPISIRSGTPTATATTSRTYRHRVGNQHALEIARDQLPPGPQRRRDDRRSDHGDRGFGSTSLVQVGNNYFLIHSSGSGPALKYNGAPVTAGQFGAWTPIGAEQTASGYEVAWKVPGPISTAVWNTDSSGNYISNPAVVSGTSSRWKSLETSFHQDLNGDGVIGSPHDGDRGVWIDQPGSGRKQLFSISGGGIVGPRAEIQRRARDGG